MLPRDDDTSSTLSAYRKKDPSAQTPGASSGPSQVMIVQQKKTRWQQLADRVREQAAGNPLLQKVVGIKDHAVVNKARLPSLSPALAVQAAANS